jgi:folate-dependent phosphoribosylglycinamide formyltransferase PurN
LLYDEAVGSSAHLVNEGVYTEAILSTRTIDISEYKTIDYVIAAIYYQCEFQAMIDGIINLINGTADPQPQTPEDRTQYFVMHPKVTEITEQGLQVEGENKGLQ